MSNLVPTSDQILASARNFIVTGGYNGFSYADIAGEVGIRKASIHHHFPSKTDLGIAVVDRYIARFGTALAAIASESVTINRMTSSCAVPCRASATISACVV